MDPLDDEPAAGDGVQQPQLQKPEGSAEERFLEKCDQFRNKLVEILKWPSPGSLTECRQEMQKWWNATLVTNPGFSSTNAKDEEEKREGQGKASTSSWKGSQASPKGRGKETAPKGPSPKVIVHRTGPIHKKGVKRHLALSTEARV